MLSYLCVQNVKCDFMLRPRLRFLYKRPWKKSVREDMAVFRRARANSFSSAKHLRELWPLNNLDFDRTVTCSLIGAGLRSKRPVKRP